MLKMRNTTFTVLYTVIGTAEDVVGYEECGILRKGMADRQD